MIKTNFPSEGIAEEGNPPVQNREVQAQIGQIRRGKVMSFIRQAQEEGGGMLERGTAKVADAYENFRDHRKWLVDNGSTASFDKQIGKLDTHVQSLKEKMQREARRFDAIAETLKTGAEDIERNKRAHLAEFEERLKKVEKQREELMEQKKKKEKEIEALRQKINDRINTGINRVKIETNYDYNLAKQGDLKKEIEEGTKSLKDHKKAHEEFSAKYDVMFGSGLKGEIRQTLNTLTFGMVSETRSEKKALGKLSQKEKDNLAPEEVVAYEKAQQGIKDDMDSKKMSFENLAIQIKEALADHAREIERLEKNLVELQATKDEIDPLVTKAKSRLYTWEARRASYAVKDKIDGLKDDKAEVGEHILTESFKNPQESKVAVDRLINVEVAELRNNIINPTYVFGEASNFNFKVSGFETVAQPEEITGALYAIREKTDKKIFALENLSTRLKSTIDSGEVKKKDEVGEIQKQIESVQKAIADLKRDLMDKIPLDKEGKIEKMVDQKAVLVDICPNMKATSDDKKDAFGNELKDQPEKDKALEILNGAITKIDELPNPLSRLRAYSKTVAFGLDNKLRVSLDQDAIDTIYRGIVDEKIPSLFSELNDPHVAVNEGLSALKIVSESGMGPRSSSEMLKSITAGVAESIKNTTMPSIFATNALVSFARKFGELDPATASAANPEGTISNLFSGKLIQSVIEKIKGEHDVFEASKKIADLITALDVVTNEGIDEDQLRRLFDETLKYLNEKSGVMRSTDEEIEQDANPGRIENIDEELEAGLNKNTAKTTTAFDPIHGDSIDSKYMEHDIALGHIKTRMSRLGLTHGERPEIEKTTKEINDRIARLLSNGSIPDLADYAVVLAEEHHPDEALVVIEAAAQRCGKRYGVLKMVGDTLAQVDDVYYRGKTQEIYMKAFDAAKEKSALSGEYLELMMSLNFIGSNDQVIEVAEQMSESIKQEFAVDANRGLRAIADFIHVSKNQFAKSASAEELQEMSLELTESIFTAIPDGHENYDRVVGVIALLEGYDLAEEADAMFNDRIEHINDQSAQELFTMIQFFGSAEPTVYAMSRGENGMDERVRGKYVDKIVSKLVAESSGQTAQNKVKNIVTIYRELGKNDFAEKSEKLIEESIDLTNREEVVMLADSLYANATELGDSFVQYAAARYARKAIELAKDNLDGMIDLMVHWADMQNDIYVETIVQARKIAAGDFNKLMSLAKAMNEHSISPGSGVNLGLDSILLEAENVAKNHVMSKGITATSEIEEVIKMYNSVRGLESQAQRLAGDLNYANSLPWDEAFYEEPEPADSEYNRTFGVEPVDSSSSGSFGNSGPNAVPQQKKPNILSRMFSSMFGSSNGGGTGTGGSNGGKK